MVFYIKKMEKYKEIVDIILFKIQIIFHVFILGKKILIRTNIYIMKFQEAVPIIVNFAFHQQIKELELGIKI